MEKDEVVDILSKDVLWIKIKKYIYLLIFLFLLILLILIILLILNSILYIKLIHFNSS